MKRKSYLLFLFSVVLFIAGCSGSDMSGSEDKASYDDSANPKTEEAESSNEVASDSKSDTTSNVTTENTQKNEPVITAERMIIHKAILEVKVKKLDDAQATIEEKVGKYNGYIVESNVYREEDTSSGKMTVRIPEQHFQSFLRDAEDEAAKILERNVTGQDVTEQYVDLESRLKSKQAVEERLLAFMKNAQKTDDLLKISSDLAKVQEEIEIIVGKMNYLKNQTSYSTVEITMYEDRVIVPDIEKGELNTWEKTKKQFVTSTNFLLSAGSALFVFFIGNLPILLLLLIAGFIFYLSIRKRIKKD